jgi:hypothetical protein
MSMGAGPAVSTAADSGHHRHNAGAAASTKSTAAAQGGDVSAPAKAQVAAAKAERVHVARVAALAYYAFASMGAQYFVKVRKE